MPIISDFRIKSPRNFANNTLRKILFCGHSDKNARHQSGVFQYYFFSSVSFSKANLEDTFGRDTGQFKSAQEATTKCIGDTLRRSDTVMAETGRIPKGCEYFLVPQCCVFVVVAIATTSSPRLPGTRKSSATRLRSIFEIGFCTFRGFFFRFNFDCG